MKYTKILSLIALASLATGASARSSFNLFLGSPCYYPTPVPIFPIPAPSLGFSMGIPLGDPCCGAPTLGFSVDVPLVAPVVRPRPIVVRRVVEPVYIESTVCRDNDDKRYWRIYNDTDDRITVMSQSNTKHIENGESCKLDHSSSFALRITDGEQKIKVRTTHHTLRIAYDKHGTLKVYTV